MECLIFSDTHGNYSLAAEVVMQSGPVDMIFHLGDVADDAAMLEHILEKNIEKVAGNCDAPGCFPREKCIELGNRRILVTHGDRYRVKSGLAELHLHAVNSNAAIVLFGHTHQALVEEIDGILYINPGSLLKGNSIKSFARLSLSDAGAKAAIVLV